MTPKSNATIFRPDLGAYVMERQHDRAEFVADRIFPTFSVQQASACYPVIPIEALFSAPSDDRAYRGAYQRDDFQYERGYYTTREHGREEPIDDAERAITDQEMPGAADYMAVERAMDKILRTREKRVADKTFNATNFTAHDITNEWDDATNATPIDDVNDAVLAFKIQCGMDPDILLMNDLVFRNLRTCDKVLARLAYTFPGLDSNRLTPAQVAQLLDVKEILVTGGMYNSADKGLSASLSRIWSSEYAALIKLCAPNDFTTPGLGRTFLFAPDSPGMPVVEQYREEQIRSDIYRVRYNADENFLRSYDSSGTVVSNISAACMYLIGNVTTI